MHPEAATHDDMHYQIMVKTLAMHNLIPKKSSLGTLNS